MTRAQSFGNSGTMISPPCSTAVSHQWVIMICHRGFREVRLRSFRREESETPERLSRRWGLSSSMGGRGRLTHMSIPEIIAACGAEIHAGLIFPPLGPLEPGLPTPGPRGRALGSGRRVEYSGVVYGRERGAGKGAVKKGPACNPSRHGL